MKSEFSTWLANVRDEFKGKPQEEIKSILQERKISLCILATHIIGDFNISSCLRSGNGFGIDKFYYFGKKKYDRRGALGVYHYTDVHYLENLDKVKELKPNYEFVALENNIDKPVTSLYDFEWKRDTILVVGEEGPGIESSVLELCDRFIEIPMDRGSVRSFNLSSAASIAMYDYSMKLRQGKF